MANEITVVKTRQALFVGKRTESYGSARITLNDPRMVSGNDKGEISLSVCLADPEFIVIENHDYAYLTNDEEFDKFYLQHVTQSKIPGLQIVK